MFLFPIIHSIITTSNPKHVGSQSTISLCLFIRGELPHYRPGEALRAPGGLYNRHISGEVVSPKHSPPLPPGDSMVIIFVRG